MCSGVAYAINGRNLTSQQIASSGNRTDITGSQATYYMRIHGAHTFWFCAEGKRQCSSHMKLKSEARMLFCNSVV